MTSLLLTLLTSDDPSSKVTLHGMMLVGNILLSWWIISAVHCWLLLQGASHYWLSQRSAAVQILSFKSITSLALYCSCCSWMTFWFKVELEPLLKCSSCCLFDIELFPQKHISWLESIFKLTGWLMLILNFFQIFLLITRWSFKLWSVALIKMI